MASICLHGHAAWHGLLAVVDGRLPVITQHSKVGLHVSKACMQAALEGSCVPWVQS